MGWPSSHEHDQEKRDDAAFLDHKMPADLRAIHVAPVTKQPKRPKPKKQAASVGGPTDTGLYVEKLERRVRDLEATLKEANQSIAAEKAHVAQLKQRGNKNSNLLLEAEVRELKAQHQAEIAELRAALETKEQEIRDFRHMQALFGKSG